MFAKVLTSQLQSGCHFMEGQDYFAVHNFSPFLIFPKLWVLENMSGNRNRIGLWIKTKTKQNKTKTENYLVFGSVS